MLNEEQTECSEIRAASSTTFWNNISETMLLANSLSQPSNSPEVETTSSCLNLGWNLKKFVTQQPPISAIAVPVAPSKNTIKKAKSRNKVSPLLQANLAPVLATAPTLKMDDEDWVGIDENYWVVDGELIDEENRQKSFGILCQKFGNWVKMKKGKCCAMNHLKKQQKLQEQIYKEQEQNLEQHLDMLPPLVVAKKEKANVVKKLRRKLKASDENILICNEYPPMCYPSIMTEAGEVSVSNAQYYKKHNLLPNAQKLSQTTPSFSSCFSVTPSKARDIGGSRKRHLRRVGSSPNLSTLLSEERKKGIPSALKTKPEEHFDTLSEKVDIIQASLLQSNLLQKVKNHQIYRQQDIPLFYDNSFDFFVNAMSSRHSPVLSKHDMYSFFTQNEKYLHLYHIQDVFEHPYHLSMEELVNELIQTFLVKKIFFPITKNIYYVPSLFSNDEEGGDYVFDFRKNSGIWTYKCLDSWKSTLSRTWMFSGENDYKQENIMPLVVSNALSMLYSASSPIENMEGNVYSSQIILIRHISCWKNACYLLLSSSNPETSQSSASKENVVEVFLHWANINDKSCVASAYSNEEYSGVPSYKLSCSAKGLNGSNSRRIYDGGYRLILSSIDSALKKHVRGKTNKSEVVCPECLAYHTISKACPFAYDQVESIANTGVEKGYQTSIICARGHSIDTRILTGHGYRQTLRRNQKFISSVSSPEQLVLYQSDDDSDTLQNESTSSTILMPRNIPEKDSTSVMDLARGVVLVGLWDGKENRIRNVGSGFIVDKKLGLIVTASHTLINLGHNVSVPFGEEYYGYKNGKAVIGVIPQYEDGKKRKSYQAVFRYFADIVVKDVNHVDACILRITTKFEKDIIVRNQGEDCGLVAEIPIINDFSAIKKEQLLPLKVSYDFEMEERVRIVGYNQGGESLMSRAGFFIHSTLDFSNGYVCKYFDTSVILESLEADNVLRNPFSVDMNSNAAITQSRRNSCSSSITSASSFFPREEIVVLGCPTITGHSGGPCVNVKGDVIGILSRVDSVDSQRCYVVPSSEWRSLLKKAKRICRSVNSLDAHIL